MPVGWLEYPTSVLTTTEGKSMSKHYMRRLADDLAARLADFDRSRQGLADSTAEEPVQSTGSYPLNAYEPEKMFATYLLDQGLKCRVSRFFVRRLETHKQLATVSTAPSAACVDRRLRRDRRLDSLTARAFEPDLLSTNYKRLEDYGWLLPMQHTKRPGESLKPLHRVRCAELGIQEHTPVDHCLLE